MINFIETHWQELLGTLFGLLYLYYEYKADMKMWPTGILMSLFYVYVFVSAGIYAFAVINIYYILAGVYGWFMWGRASQTDERNVRRAPRKVFLFLLPVVITLFLLIGYVLQYLGESTVAWGDSFITTLSIAAMWMLAQRYAEQWLLLIVANVVSAALFFYMGLYPSAVLYAVYAVVSVFGLLNWRNMALATDNKEK
ncbi:nicotinamide mononucleotide transporter [Dysgonomonas sp. PH5-45]|uniref:nicotinamide riboside transporter PnuC n=1 Tax=unclassified Dysgonomonas TaxID=2630389 RepID=UPI0024753F71|nr:MULTISPECIES: nicotinamide riboside transporter PnuC [unclassified Dysgonomonas]MDH6355218.1 nicotinamide mononucleotide transporter [Dysgonomonas sp. PH5-45]MDH6388159.1 nicotinamide mononucleotide transporter [Dysgonomonas sp. PH5-37]